NQLWTKHLGQKLSSSLPVSMLARQGAAVTDDQISGLVHELAEVRDAFFALVVEVETSVHTRVAKVAVKRSVISEVTHQPLEVAEILPQLLRCDGGVFPAFPTQRFARNVRDHPEARFADSPNMLGLGLVAQTHVWNRPGAPQVSHQAEGLGFSLLRGLPAELSEQPTASSRKKSHTFRIDASAAGVFDK